MLIDAANSKKPFRHKIFTSLMGFDLMNKIASHLNTNDTIKHAIKLIPESAFKKKAKCMFYNLKWGNKHIRFGYDKSHYTFKYYGHKFILVDQNPFIDFPSVQAFLHGYNIKSGDIIIEAGVYTGLYSIIASKLVGKKGRVISYEAHPDNYRLFLKNINLNKIKNITPINKGLWHEEKIVRLKNTDSYNTSFLLYDKPSRSKLEIKTVLLEKEIKRLELKNIKYIAMDIEGAEINVLKSMKKYLNEKKPKLAIASYHYLGGRQTYHDVENILRGYGYNVSTYFPNHLTTFAHKKNDSNF